MAIDRTLNEAEIFDEMNRRIANISLEEYHKIEKETQKEVDYTNQLLRQIKRGEYAC